jgi:Domain of unknown function (DUF4194)
VTSAARNQSAALEPDLSLVVVHLMKGALYREGHEQAWQQMLVLAPRVRDYVGVLGLTVIIDESEGYAFLRSVDVDDADQDRASSAAGREIVVPRLIPRRSLSFPVSLLLALLRKKLVEFDATDSDSRLILTRTQIVDMLRVFLPPGRHETRLLETVDAQINKTIELGFLRRVKGADQVFEVRRILKAFVDGQWLAEFDRRLAEYAAQLCASAGSNVLEENQE